MREALSSSRGKWGLGRRKFALWNTVLKLMYMQHKISHQTSMHRACRFVVKIRVCDARGYRRMPLIQNVTGLIVFRDSSHLDTALVVVVVVDATINLSEETVSHY